MTVMLTMTMVMAMTMIINQVHVENGHLNHVCLFSWGRHQFHRELYQPTTTSATMATSRLRPAVSELRTLCQQHYQPASLRLTKHQPQVM